MIALVWDAMIGALRQDPWIISMIVGAVVSVMLFYLNRQNAKNRKAGFKKIITANVRELTDIFNGINLCARKVDEDDYEAEIARSYFDRKIHRMELLRMSIETHLAQMDPDDEFSEKIRRILDAEAWLVERYHEDGSSQARRLSVWKTGYGELESRVRKAENAATDLKIRQAVVVD